MKQLFAMTLQEGTEAARCDGCIEDLFEQPSQTNYITPILGTIFFTAAIIMAMLFVKNATRNINREAKFDGTKWGLINGVFGLGFIFAIAAIILIRSEIKQARNEWYINYAKKNSLISLLHIYHLLHSLVCNRFHHRLLHYGQRTQVFTFDL